MSWTWDVAEDLSSPSNPRQSRRPRLRFWVKGEVAGSSFWLKLPNDREEKRDAPQGRASKPEMPASAAATQPEVLALRKLLDGQKDTVKEFEEATGRRISNELLWRWTRSKGGAEQALQPLLYHAVWRIQAGKINEVSIAAELEAQKVFLQGCDRQGRPVVFVIAARHVIQDRNLDETRKLICYTLEAATTAADIKLNPVGQMLCIFDLSGLSFGNLDSKALQAVFEILQQHFPECLSELWFLNAPFIFWGLWKIVSPFINPATKEKITFVHKNQQAARLCTAIPDEILPVLYGGSAAMISIEAAAQKLSAGSVRQDAQANPSQAASSAHEGRFAVLKRTGTFLKAHNPGWVAKVFGRTVKKSVLAVPRPGWTRKRPEMPLQARAFTSRVSSAWKNRPPMPRPSYRLLHQEDKTIHLAYLDVAAFYILFVFAIAAAYPLVKQPSLWAVPQLPQFWSRR